MVETTTDVKEIIDQFYQYLDNYELPYDDIQKILTLQSNNISVINKDGVISFVDHDKQNEDGSYNEYTITLEDGFQIDTYYNSDRNSMEINAASELIEDFNEIMGVIIEAIIIKLDFNKRICIAVDKTLNEKLEYSFKKIIDPFHVILWFENNTYNLSVFINCKQYGLNLS